MDRMKTFFRYLLMFLFIYLFVNVITYLNIKAMVSNMELEGIEFSNPSVTIEEAKSSRVNAIVKGKIKVDNEQPIGYRYIRADFLSDRGNILNSKYIDLQELKEGEEKEFSISTGTENVKKVKFILTDIRETGKFEANFKEFSNLLITLALAYTLIF